MAGTNQQVTGSPQVNPSPNPPKIKDAAIHWQKIPTPTIPEIIRQSQQDDTDPSPVDIQPDN